jgi:peptide/nickel transport system permease protein
MNIHVDTPTVLDGQGSRAAGAAGWALKILSRINPTLGVSAVIVMILLAWSLAPGLLAPYRPTDMDFSEVLSRPSAAHLFGTDHYGRDIFSLVVFGARQSLMVGIGVVAIGSVIGSAIGLLIGYFGRFADAAVMRLMEIWLAIPDILLIIIIATALKPGLGSLILTMGVVSIPRYIRLMRSQAIAVKARPFVDAARSIGTPRLAILVRHVAPHALSMLLVLVTLGVGRAMLTGAALSFIGLGVIDDQPDWGALLSEGRNYVTSAWWFSTLPGLVITAVVIALNLLGEALRVHLDPRSQAR